MLFSAYLCVKSAFIMRLRTFSTLLLILLLVSPAFAARVERLIDTWRPEHYLVNITLNDRLSEITSASARINVSIVKPTSVIDLDFGDLTTDSVTLNSKPVPFTHKNGKLKINLPGTGDRRNASDVISRLPRQTERRIDPHQR